MPQIFKVNPDGTTTELTADGPIKDIMKSEEVYVIVADDIRKIFLWLGSQSNVRSKFVGAKRSQDIRGQVGLHYGSVSVDEGDEDSELIRIMGGKTEAGIAKEIKEDPGAGAAVNPLRQKAIFEPPKPAEGMNIAGSRDRVKDNAGPLYTGAGSMSQFMQEEQQVNFEQIMQKLEEIQIPPGYERELIIIGNHAYSIVEKVQNFLGKKQVEKVIEKVGSIPEGVFFAEDYSPRILSENGKILAIEFLRRAGGEYEPKSKKDILQNQIKKQLG
ncbi:MAG: hypothetical protein ACFFBP_17175 [Promethearchaeota archaeon]